MLILFSSSILALIAFAQAQLGVVAGTPLFDNSTCVAGPNTTFTNCNTFYSALANCTSNTTETVMADCECKQSFFDLIVDCESELRNCTGNNTWDATLDSQMDSWHSVCDSSGVKPTTPSLAATGSAMIAKTSATATSGSVPPAAIPSVGTASGGSSTSNAAADTATSQTGRIVFAGLDKRVSSVLVSLLAFMV